jgi:hypothetical protein
MEHFGLHLLELHKWNLDKIWELIPLFPDVLQQHASLNVKPPGTQEYVTCSLRDMEPVLRDARTCTLCIKLLKDNFKQQKLEPLMASPNREPKGPGINISGAIFLNKWQFQL